MAVLGLLCRACLARVCSCLPAVWYVCLSRERGPSLAVAASLAVVVLRDRSPALPLAFAFAFFPWVAPGASTPSAALLWFACVSLSYVCMCCDWPGLAWPGFLFRMDCCCAPLFPSCLPAFLPAPITSTAWTDLLLPCTPTSFSARCSSSSSSSRSVLAAVALLAYPITAIPCINAGLLTL
jgi:hypothetical protein